MSKLELEAYGREYLDIELDRRLTKEKLIEQLQESPDRPVDFEDFRPYDPSYVMPNEALDAIEEVKGNRLRKNWDYRCHLALVAKKKGNPNQK